MQLKQHPKADLLDTKGEAYPVHSPVDGVVFFAGDGLEVCKFQEPIMEVVEV